MFNDMNADSERDRPQLLSGASSDLSRYPTEVFNSPPSPAATNRNNEIEARRADRTLTREQSRNLSIIRTATATEEPELTRWQEIGFIFIICMAQLLTQASLAQTIAPVHDQGATFNTQNAGQLSWLTAGYSLTVGTFILPAGRWGDLYGHRLLFGIGYAWFAVWSLVSGFAAFSHSLIFFAACRGLQGIGPAILIPNGLAILGRTYPPGPRKNMVFSLFGAAAPGGFVFGALFSGIFAELVWWPWTLWVAGIILALCCVMVFFVVPAMPVAGGRPRLAELDPWGTLFGISGLVLFNFAWNQGPTVGWQTVYVYVLLIVGCILLGIFAWLELKVVEFPLVPTSVFSTQTSLVLACIALGWASFGIFIYYVWNFLELLRGDSILLATAESSPVLVMGAVAAVLTGRLLGRIGPGYVMLAAMCAFMTGNILLATVPVSQTYWAQTFVAFLITPFGMDMSFPAGSIILSNHMPREFQGIAASVLCVIQNYAISIGLGMGGTVERQVSGGDLLKGYRGAWYLAIGLDVLGIGCALALIVSWRSTVKAKEKAGEKVILEEA